MSSMLPGGLAIVGVGAAAGMAAAAAGAPGFACTASGTEMIAPMTAEAACARVRAGVEQAIGAPLSERAGGPGVRVSLTFGKMIAKAEVVDARDGAERQLPTQYYSIADKALGAEAVDALARAVGAILIKT